MDRAPDPVIDVLPPPDPGSAYRPAIFGLVLVAATAALGLALDLSGNGDPSVLSTIRLVAVAIGLLSAAGGLSRRPDLPGAWGLAAASALLARFALPEHWDSIRMAVTVLGLVGLVGAGITALPAVGRRAVLSGLAVAHFGGIMCAVTWPEPTPWLTNQVGTRVYLPYLWFMYLRNAYHFYSPEPGPASMLFCLVQYDETDPKTGKPVSEWVWLPNRATDMKDPLGLAYYRRLAITEQVAATIPTGNASFEKREVDERRTKAAGGLGGFSNYPRIPVAPEEFEPFAGQYRMPRPDVARYVLPSYARHLLQTHSTDGRRAVGVKLYRIEHRILPVNVFVGTTPDPNLRSRSPHHPTWMRPYFLGEFKIDPETGQAELADPQDPMLYWLVPILPRRPGTGDSKDQRDFEDFLSKHAGFQFPWEERAP